jgi:hypothetical protein
MANRMRQAAAPISLLLALGLLSGCESVGKALGFSKNTPDEFRVVERAPLEVPPDFNLRPPQPGSPRPQELERDNRATASVFGAAGASFADSRGTAGQSRGEVALLGQAGAERADPEIRAIVDRENPGVVVGDRTLLDRLLFWRDDPNAQSQHQGAPPTIARTGSSSVDGAVGPAPAGTPAETTVPPKP